MFFRLTELNSWSHATYYYIAAGCYFSLANFDKAQELFNSIPALLEGKKIGGKDLPTEVFIRKKLAFFKEKQKRRGGDEAQYVQAIKISPAEEIAIFWNTHNRIDKAAVTSHIDEWSALSPAVTADKPDAKAAENASLVDLDTSDELALRSLLLGIVNRSGGDYTTSRIFLTDAHQRHSKVVVSTWIGGISLFEMAVLDLQEAVGTEKAGGDPAWDATLKIASGRLDQALALGGKSVDLSSRLDSRILMLKDEIANKRGMLGIA
jgi:tetratricopeptide (TPR) repeat protein